MRTQARTESHGIKHIHPCTTAAFKVSSPILQRISNLLFDFWKMGLWAHLVSVGAIGGLDLEHAAPLRLDHQAMAQVQAGYRTGLKDTRDMHTMRSAVNYFSELITDCRGQCL